MFCHTCDKVEYGVYSVTVIQGMWDSKTSGNCNHSLNPSFSDTPHYQPLRKRNIRYVY